MEVIVLGLIVLYLTWLVAGFRSPVTAGAALLVGALTWAVRRWRKQDAFGVESFTLGVLEPRMYEAQPCLLDPTRKPKPAIPRRPVK